jgi:hypothetical protein
VSQGVVVVVVVAVPEIAWFYLLIAALIDIDRI